MKKRKILLIVMTIAMVVSLFSVTAFAVDGDEIMPLSETGSGIGLDAFITSIKGGLSDFSTVNLATILVASLSISVGLCIAWFAYRFIKRRVSTALRGGKL